MPDGRLSSLNRILLLYIIRWISVTRGGRNHRSCQVAKGRCARSQSRWQEGNIIAKVKIPKSAAWKNVRAQVLHAPLGVHALHVSLQSGADVEVDWLGFDALPWEKGAFETHQYRNLFAEMGYRQADIDKKLNEVFHDVFYGKNKVYFEVGDSMGYVSDVKNNDVRTEGMSYGMMAAVQFGKKDIFDRLWRWSKRYMQHQKGPYKAILPGVVRLMEREMRREPHRMVNSIS